MQPFFISSSGTPGLKLSIGVPARALELRAHGQRHASKENPSGHGFVPPTLISPITRFSMSHLPVPVALLCLRCSSSLHSCRMRRNPLWIASSATESVAGHDAATVRPFACMTAARETMRSDGGAAMVMLICRWWRRRQQHLGTSAARSKTCLASVYAFRRR